MSQQLERLGSKGIYWQTESLSSAAGESTLNVHVYIFVCLYTYIHINVYIFIFPSEPPSYSTKEGAGEGMSDCDLCGWPFIYMLYTSVCVCLLCMPMNMSAMLLVGPGITEPQQPHVLWAVKSGMINFPLTDGTDVGPKPIIFLHLAGSVITPDQYDVLIKKTACVPSYGR